MTISIASTAPPASTARRATPMTASATGPHLRPVARPRLMRFPRRQTRSRRSRPAATFAASAISPPAKCRAISGHRRRIIPSPSTMTAGSQPQISTAPASEAMSITPSSSAHRKQRAGLSRISSSTAQAIFSPKRTTPPAPRPANISGWTICRWRWSTTRARRRSSITSTPINWARRS